MTKYIAVRTIGQMVRQCADAAGVNRRLIAAMVVQESNCDPWAFRFEKRFYERYLKDKKRDDLAGVVPFPLPSLENEKLFRSCSYGLLQILGETARSQLGFRGQYLTELCDPQINLTLGCAFVQKLLVKTKGDTRAMLLKWNGGGRLEYPTEVFAKAETDSLVEKLLVI